MVSGVIGVSANAWLVFRTPITLLLEHFQLPLFLRLLGWGMMSRFWKEGKLEVTSFVVYGWQWHWRHGGCLLNNFIGRSFFCFFQLISLKTVTYKLYLSRTNCTWRYWLLCSKYTLYQKLQIKKLTMIPHPTYVRCSPLKHGLPIIQIPSSHRNIYTGVT